MSSTAQVSSGSADEDNNGYVHDEEPKKFCTTTKLYFAGLVVVCAIILGVTLTANYGPPPLTSSKAIEVSDPTTEPSYSPTYHPTGLPTYSPTLNATKGNGTDSDFDIDAFAAAFNIST
jgi:hypothetical protein